MVPRILAQHVPPEEKRKNLFPPHTRTLLAYEDGWRDEVLPRMCEALKTKVWHGGHSKGCEQRRLGRVSVFLSYSLIPSLSLSLFLFRQVYPEFVPCALSRFYRHRPRWLVAWQFGCSGLKVVAFPASLKGIKTWEGSSSLLNARLEGTGNVSGNNVDSGGSGKAYVPPGR